MNVQGNVGRIIDAEEGNDHLNENMEMYITKW